MGNYLFIFLLFIVSNTYSQSSGFDFYGNNVQGVALTNMEYDTLLKNKVTPLKLQKFLQSNISNFELEDWSIVLFVNKFVQSQLNNIDKADKIKIESVILNYLNINNGIGVRNKNQLLSLLIVNKKVSASAYTFDENGIKLISPDLNKEPFKIRNVDIALFKGNDILFNGKCAKINATDYDNKTISFINYNTKQPDSISFSYSNKYINYSYDFPMVIGKKNYKQYPVSPFFITTLIKALDVKIKDCKSKLDSINFLLQFVETAVKNELNETTYGRNGFSCYPENTIVNGKGDCDDKCVLLYFLLSYYFNNLDMAFLHYDYNNHIRLGISDSSINFDSKSFIEYYGKKYVIADPTFDSSELGDESFKFDPRPDDIYN